MPLDDRKPKASQRLLHPNYESVYEDSRENEEKRGRMLLKIGNILPANPFLCRLMGLTI
jgi:hypothetical protein